MEEMCGICFESVIDRGKLDSCDHAFCFACILEWSKVESKCPYCKQRFVTISKPGRPGITRSRTIRIPTRNQVHVPSEEDVVVDGYSTLVCTECFESGEDGRLLLCDGCDSAAHTFCVGLRSVPRGEWFCSRCVQEQAGLVPEDEDEEEEKREVIVLEDDGYHRVETEVVRTIGLRNVRHGRGSRTCPVHVDESEDEGRARTVEHSATLDEMGGNLFSAAPSARTLSSQRVVQQRIQRFRDQWERIRAGTEEFETETTDAGVPPEPEKTAEERDVAKAWKMMDKSLGSSQEQPSKTKKASGSSRPAGDASRTPAPRPGVFIGQSEDNQRPQGYWRPATGGTAPNSGPTSDSTRKAEVETTVSSMVSRPRPSVKTEGNVQVHKTGALGPMDSSGPSSGSTSGSKRKDDEVQSSISKEVKPAELGVQTNPLQTSDKRNPELRRKKKRRKIEDDEERKDLKEKLFDIVKQHLLPLYKREEISKEKFRKTARGAVKILFDNNTDEKLRDWKSLDMAEQAKEAVTNLLSMGTTTSP